MSGADSDEGRLQEVTERYRAASAADTARPGEAAREAILSYARTIAVNHANRATARARGRSPAVNDSSWRISVAASVIVAVFATVLAWHVHAPAPVPGPESELSPSQLAARHPPATEAKLSSQASESLPSERRASAPPPAPNAVTTRSRERAAGTGAASRAHEAAADLQLEADSVASSRAVQPGIAGGTAAENAAAGSAGHTASASATPSDAAQAAPTAAAAPRNLPAPRSQALAASARTAPAPTPPLLTAAEAGSLERVDELLRGGASTEQTDARGRTALLIATLRGDTAMVGRLLAAGARADVADDNGDTPLTIAQRQGPPELARLLERAAKP
jgi:hypothetical protein